MATEHAEGDVAYVDGNKFNPVIVLGDDPENEDNVIVVRLGTSESVARDSVRDEEPYEPA